MKLGGVKYLSQNSKWDFFSTAKSWLFLFNYPNTVQEWQIPVRSVVVKPGCTLELPGDFLNMPCSNCLVLFLLTPISLLIPTFNFFLEVLNFAVVFRSLGKPGKVCKPPQQTKLMDTKGRLQLQRTLEPSETYTMKTS